LVRISGLGLSRSRRRRVGGLGGGRRGIERRSASLSGASDVPVAAVMGEVEDESLEVLWCAISSGSEVWNRGGDVPRIARTARKALASSMFPSSSLSGEHRGSGSGRRGGTRPSPAI
jgi:hypothetical protein